MKARMSPRPALLAPLLALLAACAPEPPPGPSLLVITLDTTRADLLGAYGSRLGATPRLDALAAQGVVFEDAYAPMPQTLPSHATLFTGREPRRHGAVENATVLPAAVETLAEDLARRGWDTAACIGARVLEAGTGIEQGFAHFDQPEGVARDAMHPVERRADAVTDAALWWAGRRADPAQPFLLWAHYYDTHGPYEPVQERVPLAAVRAEVERRDRAAPGELSGLPLPEIARLWHAHVNELAEVDAQVGRLLDGLRQRGLLERTAILVVGDHGEGLMEHGEKGHGATIYEELMRVPLVLVAPGLPPARVRGRIALHEVLPTACEAFGLGAPPDGAEGRSRWSEAAAGRPLAPGPLVVERPFYLPGGERAGRAEAHAWGFGLLAAVIMDDAKLLRFPDGREQLFDLAADPAELVDVAASRPELRARLAALLDEWLKANPPPSVEDGAAPSEERLRTLEALGYVQRGG